jgi:hypothetical protein
VTSDHPPSQHLQPSLHVRIVPQDTTTTSVTGGTITVRSDSDFRYHTRFGQLILSLSLAGLSIIIDAMNHNACLVHLSWIGALAGNE